MVRTHKECEPTKYTHFLNRAAVETGQDTERIQASDGNSLAGEGTGREWSGHRRKRANEGHAHPGEGRSRNQSVHVKNMSH